MYTVLIVDDEENIRKALIRSVDWESLGFNIIADVSNGIEALVYIENEDIDLLVTDIKMPIMGGIELARISREIRPSMQIVFLSGHDQFSFAIQAIKYNIMSYILKPITDEDILHEFTIIKEKLDEKFTEILNVDDHYDTLKELQNTKRELLVTKLIKHGFTMSQLQQTYKKTDIKIPIQSEKSSKYVVCVVKSDISEYNNESEMKIKRIYNISKIVSEKYLGCECSVYYDCAVIIAYGTQETLDKFLPILSKDIVMSSKRVMNMKIYFGQSNYYENILETNIAFKEALEAVNIVDKNNAQIVHIKDIASNDEIISLDEQFHEFEQKMLSGDSDGVSFVLGKIFFGVKNDSKEFNAIVLQILSVILKVCGTLEGSIYESIVKAFAVDIDSYRIKDEIINLSLNITVQIANSRQKSVDNLASSAIAIIEKEYNDPEISLGSISEKIYCSPNYLSSIIRKTTGESFVDILTRVRLEKANALLLTTNKKIREISEECGYANQHYFSYSFKKYFNKSPNTIRKEMSLSEATND